MSTSYDDFWGRIGKAAPGMFDLGAGVYGATAGRKEAADRLRAAQGPNYDQQMQMAGGMLSRASSFDPVAAGTERFNQAQRLLAPKDATDMASLQRLLQLRGQGGAASYTGVDAGGAPVNPQIAAYLQEKNRRDAQMVYDSLNQGDKMLDSQINRAGTLQRQAAGVQDAGMKVQASQPSRTLSNMNILKGISGIAKDTGLFSSGIDWLRNFNTPALWGAGSAPRFDFGGYDWDGF
jgi:hypothetical protein